MEEIWKDIVDYNNLYQVSNLGRVKRLETNITIFNKKTQYNKKVKGKILKNTKDKKGYLYVALCKNGKTKKINQGSISNVCNGIRKTAGGYKWRWLY